MKRNLATKSLLGTLVTWTVRLVFGFTVLVIGGYCLGSYLGFEDRVQFFLVRLCMFVSVLLCLASIWGIFLDILYVFRYKNSRFLLGAAGYVLIALFGSLAACAAAFILSLAGGNA
ncbi:MAG: hypothetical protein LBP69_11475 [Treponema sp.]|jgi:hypothetical protein|nr:hypothetical protein [Treponema sp.]